MSVDDRRIEAWRGRRSGNCAARKIFVAMLVLLSAASPAPAGVEKASPVMDVSLRGERVRMAFDPWFGGAASQLHFRGMQFINASDHGRLVQSALSLDGWGECLNPTEAGSVNDGRQRRTTSRLLGSEVRNGVWHSRTQMAYWIAPGDPHQVNPSDLRVHREPQPCSPDPARRHVTSARNSLRLSDVVLDKHISVAGPARDLLRFSVAFELKRGHEQVMFEALTAYLEPRFDRFYELDGSGRLVQMTPVQASDRPVIAATSNGRHAMGMAARAGSNLKLGVFRWPDTSKLNCFGARGPITAGSHRFECFVSVGSLEEVRATMARFDR